jgi:cysteine-S-conjugate beta-lyase
MQYNFDEIVDRQGTGAFKTDGLEMIYGHKNLIPLWVADMDFKTPDFVIAAVKERLKHEVFGYTMRQNGFFDSILNWVQIRHQWQIEKDWIAFSPGVVPACSLSILSFTNPGDSIIIQPPVYFPFFDIVENQGRKLLINQLIEENGRYTMDFNDLEEKAAAGAKMLIICSPHNPGGSVWTREELSKLAGIVVKHQLIVISDEIHSDLIMKPNRHIPLASLNEEIANRTITTIAPSKTFNMAGFSTSAVIIKNKEIRDSYLAKMSTVHIGHGNILGNVACQAAYEHGEEWLEQLLAYLKGNIDYVSNYIHNHFPEIKVMIPEATYLVWIDFSTLKLSNKELQELMIMNGLAMNDGPMFGAGGEGFQRMNVSCPRSVLVKAMEHLSKAITSVKPN